MIIQSKNFILKLEEIPREKTSHIHFNDTEKNVFSLVKKWVNGEKIFEFETSGSTGAKKNIAISREKIEYSTHSSFALIDPTNQIRTSLLCINPQFMGGAMVVFRALIKKHDLYIVEPTSSLMEALSSDFETDLVSMIPMQFKSIPKGKIRNFKNILIGGTPSEVINNHFCSNIYSTYGMTETVSHIALRRINEELFTTTGDVMIRKHKDGTLMFNGTITNDKWLITNDTGEIVSKNSFRWFGRKDFVINSGGIKLNPEMIEQKISDKIDAPFLITSLPDNKFGEKVVLVIEGNHDEPVDFSTLSQYEMPKKIITNIELKKTRSGKIDRINTRKQLITHL